ncbi:MAG: outer membrane protein transport protein [Deltaproteobacteria bacterium]|nr:outer membrane protein transport protein [Deltaproteobacteria bacterium]
MKRAAVLLGACVALSAGPAWAGGAWVGVRGVRPLSMGGAFVAGAEEANALWYNPSRLDGTSVAMDLGGVFMSAGYTAPDGTAVSNTGRTLPNPTLGAVYKIADLISIGAGIYAPYSPQHRFPEDGPQRYSLVESDRITMLIMNVGVALRLGPVRIGGGVQNVDFHLRQRTVLSGYTGLFSEPTDPDLDVLSELELHDAFTLTGNLGVSADLGPVTLGAAVQLPWTAKGQATFRVRLGQSTFFDPITVEGDTADFAVPFPWMARAGVLWRANDSLKMELAFNWEGWSVQDSLIIDPKGQITLRDVPGIGDYQMGKLTVDRGMKDTISLHYGADYTILTGLHARGGLFYETSAFPDATFSVAQVDSSKLGFGAGGSYQWRWFRLDAAVSYVHQFSRDVTDSRLRQVNPTNPDQAVIVGNGQYTSHIWIAGFGLAWMLDAP